MNIHYCEEVDYAEEVQKFSSLHRRKYHCSNLVFGMDVCRTLPFKIVCIRCKGVSRTRTTSKMELFVALVNGF